MTTWTNPRIVYLPDRASCGCERIASHHPALFRAELVDADSGVVRHAWMCHARAKAFAERYQIEFPPWRDQEQHT